MFCISGNELPSCFLKGLFQLLLGECGGISLQLSYLSQSYFFFSALVRNLDPVGIFSVTQGMLLLLCTLLLAKANVCSSAPLLLLTGICT